MSGRMGEVPLKLPLRLAEFGEGLLSILIGLYIRTNVLVKLFE
jgi:hypothetical protein